MQDIRARSFQTVVTAITIDAAKVGELLGMAAEVYLIVGLVKRAERREQLALIVSLESGPGNCVEDSIRAVAIGGRKSAALGFQIIDVLRINLRPDVARDIGIRNGNAVDRPAHLVSASHVQLIVRDPRPRHVIGNGPQAVAQIRARRGCNFAPADDRSGRHLLRTHCQSGFRYAHLFLPRSQRKLKMQNRRAA